MIFIVKNFMKKYGKNLVLDYFLLCIELGEFVVIMGFFGSGKLMFFGLFFGFDKFIIGKVNVLGCKYCVFVF